MRWNYSVLFALSLSVSACGGSQKSAEGPEAESTSAEQSSEAESEASSDAPSSKEEEPAAGGEDSADGKSSEKETTESSSGMPAIQRTPKDVLTAPDVVFMFSFNESDVKKVAEEQCDKRAKDNPKKRAECMTKEKNKISTDGMVFSQEKNRWYWSTVRRKGKTLVYLHKVPVEFEKETATTVVLKPVGKDEGTMRGRGAPGETEVEVPNDYQMILQDPKHGKMVFEAKVGLLGEQQR